MGNLKKFKVKLPTDVTSIKVEILGRVIELHKGDLYNESALTKAFSHLFEEVKSAPTPTTPTKPPKQPSGGTTQGDILVDDSSNVSGSVETPQGKGKGKK